MTITPQQPTGRQWDHYLATAGHGDTASPSQWLCVGNSRAAGFDRDPTDIAALTDQPFLNIGNYGATISDFWWEFDHLQSDHGFDFSQEKFIINCDVANDAHFNTDTASNVGQAALALVHDEQAAAPGAVILWIEAEYDPGRDTTDTARIDAMNNAVRFQANHTGDFIFVKLPTVDMTAGGHYSDDGAHYTEAMYQEVIWPKIAQALEAAGVGSPFDVPSHSPLLAQDTFRFEPPAPMVMQHLTTPDLGHSFESLVL